MSTSAESLTPSLKRSKWDESDGNDSPTDYARPHSPKRRIKARLPESSPASLARPQLPPPTRPSHSIFVPPRSHHPPLLPSRSVYCYERLNQIEEGTYGVVFRAREKSTGDIVALKKLKLDEERQGFPITALREINALMSCRHENVVNMREIVVGDTLTQCVQSFTSLSPPADAPKGFS
jgi:cell division cycle 2-like protein